jgi:molybdopterin/thiamine biosynthesis adenylyltransferase
MRATLAMTSATHQALAAALADPRESASVLRCQLVRQDEELTLLARTLAWPAEEHYLTREPHGLELRSTGWVPAFRAAASAGDLALFVHTHPGGHARFSGYDDTVDAQLRAASQNLGMPGPYGAVLLAGHPDRPAFAARLYLDSGLVEITRIRIVDDRLTVESAHTTPSTPTAGYAAETFDRQIRLFGNAGQDLLRGLHVGVVGAGGTGSAVAEQLARLGVGRLTLVDDDVVTAPTPTRGYGFRVHDYGQPKAQVLAAHIEEIGFGTDVRTVAAPLHHPDGLAALAHADMVFSCVDGHGARLILNRWAYAHLAAVLDLAVLVTTEPTVSIDARVTWIGPGSACLLCRGRIDPALAYAENLDPDRRRELAGEGYVAAADTAQPAVVTLTSLIASTATTEMLLRLFGIGDVKASEILVRPHLHETRRNRATPRPGCFCTDPTFSGRGTQTPYLDVMWP